MLSSESLLFPVMEQEQKGSRPELQSPSRARVFPTEPHPWGKSKVGHWDKLFLNVCVLISFLKIYFLIEM